MPTPIELIERARLYAQKNDLMIDFDNPLGSGIDGAVWRTNRNSAVKSLLRLTNYLNELRCYQRLKERNIGEICGIHVPVLVNCDDDLLIVEMDIVEPPFLLDFGKAYIDTPPPYTPDQLAAWEQEWTRLFPKKDIPTVRRVVAALRGLGIEYLDQKPQNIMLRFDDTVFPSDDEYTDFEQT
jgi:hypothetical protein